MSMTPEKLNSLINDALAKVSHIGTVGAMNWLACQLTLLEECALEPQGQALPPEGQEISVDVSTGEHDALHRVFARLTSKTASDGTWLAEKTGDNLPAAVQPVGMFVQDSAGFYHQVPPAVVKHYPDDPRIPLYARAALCQSAKEGEEPKK